MWLCIRLDKTLKNWFDSSSTTLNQKTSSNPMLIMKVRMPSTTSLTQLLTAVLKTQRFLTFSTNQLATTFNSRIEPVLPPWIMPINKSQEWCQVPSPESLVISDPLKLNLIRMLTRPTYLKLSGQLASTISIKTLTIWSQKQKPRKPRSLLKKRKMLTFH